MQHELGPGFEDIRKWAKLAERYSNDSLTSGKDIAEIKATLNDLATQQIRTQLSAVTPERRTVQYTDSAPTRTRPREPLPAAPIRNFDPITGQRLNSTPLYDVITRKRLQLVNINYRQRQESSHDRPPPQTDLRHLPTTIQDVTIACLIAAETITDRHHRSVIVIKDIQDGKTLHNIIA